METPINPALVALFYGLAVSLGIVGGYALSECRHRRAARASTRLSVLHKI